MDNRTIFLVYIKMRCTECRHEFEYTPLLENGDPSQIPTEPKFCPACGKPGAATELPAVEPAPPSDDIPY
jgi:ribosomal protein L33